MRRTWIAMALSVLALGVVAGCGGDDDDGGGADATTEQPAPAPADTGAEETAPAEEEPAGGGQTVTADETEIAWQPDELTAEAGSVTIMLENPSQIPHNVTIEETGDASETITDGTTSVTTELEAGEYTYFCSVGNHRQLGMEGMLTVE